MHWAAWIFPQTPEKELSTQGLRKHRLSREDIATVCLVQLYTWLCFMGGSVSTPSLSASAWGCLCACV